MSGSCGSDKFTIHLEVICWTREHTRPGRRRTLLTLAETKTVKYSIATSKPINLLYMLKLCRVGIVDVNN